MYLVLCSHATSTGHANSPTTLGAPVAGLDVDLTKRTAIVTGGGTGIGRATGLLLAAVGANVVVAGRNESSLEETVELIKANGGGGGCAVVADVRKESDTRALVEKAVNHFGGLDILVNNAGGTYLRPLQDLRLDSWENNIALNLNSVFMLTQAALPHLIASRGTVVNVSSSAASGGFRTGSAYSAAKSGVEMFTRVCAAELGEHGIRVNCVAPGMVGSEGARRSWERGGLDVAAAERIIPLRRVGEPEDIAQAILFLASDVSSFITGEVLHVDGGPRMDGPQ
jgi:NAD(P)-dependent dehydrogenase (short-subunit alcohol dehydrogenase family)